MPKVSIIVPVYKAEAYLSRCVESIFAQSCTDFELLLIDDAGPDRSGQLCDQFAAKDKRIRVIHKAKNEGASAARNTGLDAATGEYIMFCDSDDAVSPHWIQHLLEFAAPGVLPVSTFCTEHSQLGTPAEKDVPPRKRFHISAYFDFNKAGLAGYITNALYENRILQERAIRFRTQQEKGDYNEDLLFALQYCQSVDEVIYTGYADYWYNQHNDSLSRSYSKFYFPKYAEKYSLWKSFILNNLLNEELPNLATRYLYHFLFSLKAGCRSYVRFRRMVLSEELQDCIWLADCSKENPRIINMLKKKAVFRLWIFYVLHSLKG